MTMSWALIIATIGRSAELSQLIATLAAQTDRDGAARSDLRVVIVDQNSDDRLLPIIAAAPAALCIERICIPPRGVSDARNAGLALLGDEAFVAFPDDDSFFESCTLARVEDAFAEVPDAGIVLGCLHRPEAALLLPTPHLSSALHRPSRIGMLKDAGMPMQFYRRAAAIAAGRFDITLGPGGGTPWLCGEDSDFLLAAVAADYQVVRTPAVRVFHPPVDLGAAISAKAYGYGRGRMHLLRKHRYPWWFCIASIVHPVTQAFMHPSTMVFRWNLFRGRLHELILPHRLS